jgi:CheY-like chemotaxis protein
MSEREVHVLVVDDTPSNLKVLRTLLVANGYGVTTADNGQAALDSAAADPPDLVLMDVVMPGMDGYEACRRLRQLPSSASVPIVMVTASAPLERDRAAQAGANDVVMKPIDAEAVLALIRSLLHQAGPAA